MKPSLSMIRRNPVEAAAAMAKPVLDNKDLAHEIALCYARLTRLESVSPLGLEADAEKALDTEFEACHETLQQLLRQQAATAIGDPRQLKVFDLTPLTWRNKEDLPVLGVFKPEAPTFQIWCRHRDPGWGAITRRSVGLTPKFPEEVVACYADTHKRLRRRANATTLTARFTGAIPDPIRQVIRAAEQIFKAVFLVAEVPGWTETVRKPRPVRVADPLVIGYSEAFGYRLVAAFDLTPIEKLVADQIAGVKHPRG